MSRGLRLPGVDLLRHSRRLGLQLLLCRAGYAPRPVPPRPDPMSRRHPVRSVRVDAGAALRWTRRGAGTRRSELRRLLPVRCRARLCRVAALPARGDPQRFLPPRRRVAAAMRRGPGLRRGRGLLCRPDGPDGVRGSGADVSVGAAVCPRRRRVAVRGFGGSRRTLQRDAALRRRALLRRLRHLPGDPGGGRPVRAHVRTALRTRTRVPGARHLRLALCPSRRGEQPMPAPATRL